MAEVTKIVDCLEQEGVGGGIFLFELVDLGVQVVTLFVKVSYSTVIGLKADLVGNPLLFQGTNVCFHLLQF